MFKMAWINLNLKPHLISILLSALQVRVLSEEKHGDKLKLEKKSSFDCWLRAQVCSCF